MSSKELVCCRIDFVHDAFGREKHKLHSENMGGVGSFEKDCRTLYVGRLGNNYDTESDLWSEFSEWGEIEVRYSFSTSKTRTNNRVRCLVLLAPRTPGKM